MATRRQGSPLTLVITALVWASACGGGGGGGSSPPPPSLAPVISVGVTPATASVFLGATQQFTATVANSTNQGVNWTVNGVAGGNATLGTISAAGLYTAPQNLPSPVAVNISAASQADLSKTASASVTVASDVAVSVAPNTPTILLGALQQFAATVTGSGNPNRNVNWVVAGTGCANTACGTVDGNGLYRAPPALFALPVVTLTATSQADGSKSSATTVNLSSGNLSVTVMGPATVDNGSQANFLAVVDVPPGSAPVPTVTFSVSCAGCTGSPGTIDPNTGRYTAPLLAPSPNQVTITATSNADTSKSGSASASINTLLLVVIDPADTGVELETPRQFSAGVAGTADQRVIWDVNGITGGDVTLGTIQNPANGPTSPTTYTAPVNLPPNGTVTVRATSVASMTDPGGVKSASATVNLFSNIAIGISPVLSTRAVNRRATLQLNVTNGLGGPANKNVTWMVNGIAGGSTSVGQICVSNFTPCVPIPGPTSAVSVDYLAPANVPGVNPVTINAVSEADPRHAGSAQVTVIPDLQVSVSPASSTVSPGGSQPVAATVVGTTDQRVTWMVNGIANGDPIAGQICLVASNPCMPPAGPLAGNVEYRAPGVAPNPDTVTIRATSAEDATRSGQGAVTIATGLLIQTLLPSSLTASPFGLTLRIAGLNFALSNPGPAAEAVVNGGVRSAVCTSPVPPVTICTTNLNDVEVSNPGDILVQLRNPDMKLSNQVIVVVAPQAAEDVIALSAGAPEAAGKDIIVVEAPTAGAGSPPVNIQFVGLFSGSACNALSGAVYITRPAAGQSNVDICVQGTLLSSAFPYTISGAAPNDIPITNVRSFGIGVAMTLTLSSTTQPGPRTILVEADDKQKAAATGAIVVK